MHYQALARMPAAAASKPAVPERTVLVTVGSTKFDALIRAVDDERIADALRAQGYDALIMQVRFLRLGHTFWIVLKMCMMHTAICDPDACKGLSHAAMEGGHAASVLAV